MEIPHLLHYLKQLHLSREYIIFTHKSRVAIFTCLKNILLLLTWLVKLSKNSSETTLVTASICTISYLVCNVQKVLGEMLLGLKQAQDFKRRKL